MSIEELIRETSSMKVSAEELSARLAATSQGLSQSNSNMVSLVTGSRRGEDAVRAVADAVRALQNSSLLIKQMGRECEEFIHQVSQ